MSKEFDPNLIYKKIENFIFSNDENILFFPIQMPEDQPEKSELTLNYYLAVFSRDIEGAKIVVLGKKDTSATKYYLKEIFEMDEINPDFDFSKKDFDAWSAVCSESYLNDEPIFVLSFVSLNGTDDPGAFLKIRKGVSPEEAFFYLNKYASIELGINFQFEDADLA